MLEVTDATLHYGAAQALRGVSLKAGAGKITCVLGRNGVGKTSLMRSIVGHQADIGKRSLRGEGARPERGVRSRPVGHRIRAAGQGDVPAADRQGKPGIRLRAAEARRPQHSRRMSSSCSRC